MQNPIDLTGTLWAQLLGVCCFQDEIVLIYCNTSLDSQNQRQIWKFWNISGDWQLKSS